MLTPDSSAAAPRVATGSRVATGAMLAWLALVPGIYAVDALPVGHRMSGYIALHLILTLLGWVVWRALAASGTPTTRRLVRQVVLVGVAGQLLLIAAPPLTSTDARRYLWDGAVLLHAAETDTLADGNPYEIPPSDPSLDALASLFPRPLDHLDVVTCYPPLAMGVFALLAVPGAALGWWLWKILLAAAAIVTLLLVWRRLRGTPHERHVALLGLSPLWLLEAGVGAHLDTLVALALTGSLLEALAGHSGRAGLLLGVAAALKLTPVLLLLALIRHVPRPWVFASWVLPPLAITGLAAWLVGIDPIGSIPLMARHWSFGSPVWYAIDGVASSHVVRWRVALFSTMLLGLLWVGLRARTASRSLVASLGLTLMLNPTLYPWYAQTLVPTVALAATERTPHWALGLLLVLPTSYEVVDLYQATGVWSPALWPVALVAGVFLAGALLTCRQQTHGLAVEPGAA